MVKRASQKCGVFLYLICTGQKFLVPLQIEKSQCGVPSPLTVHQRQYKDKEYK